MAPLQPAITRRALLGAAAVLPLTGCAKDRSQSSTDAAASATPTGSPTVSASPSIPQETLRPELVKLEQRFDAILGVYATVTATGATIVHRADERFAFCSAFKGWAAAA